MNSPVLYRSRGRWMFWRAFLCAVGIHLAAVVLAKTNSESIKVESLTPLAVEMEVIESESNPIPPEDSFTPPPLEQIPPDQGFFSEEAVKESKIHSPKRIRLASPRGGITALLHSVKALVKYAPRPVYPYEARRLRITGSGTALLTVDPTEGNVAEAVMLQSCGNAILDKATLDALRQWRFKAGTPMKVQVPITYALMGVSY